MGLMGFYEFMPSNQLLTFIGQFYCNEQAITAEMCANAMFMVAGYDSGQLNRVSLKYQRSLRKLQIQLADTEVI